jgi:N-methylhydantoinase B
MEFGHADDEPFVVSKMFDRVQHPPRGRLGGGPGACAEVYLVNDRGVRGPNLKGMGREIIPAGQRMVLETAGGGGRGDPQDRAPARVERDRRNGLL